MLSETNKREDLYVIVNFDGHYIYIYTNLHKYIPRSMMYTTLDLERQINIR